MNPKGAGAVAGVRGFSLGSRAMLYRLVFRTWHMMLGGSDYTSKLWSLYVVPAIQAARLDVACSSSAGRFRLKQAARKCCSFLGRQGGLHDHMQPKRTLSGFLPLTCST